jgi:homoaconitase/3-isopropylmalate dehydratase large subunit
VALAQEGHTRPGEVLFGTDSHTCNAGAFGQFATGIGNTDAAFVLGTGKLLIKVPASMKFDLNGQVSACFACVQCREGGFDGVGRLVVRFGVCVHLYIHALL